MKHVILGAGAVGGLVGAALAQEGEHVTLLVRPETLAQHPNRIFVDRPGSHIKASVRVEPKFTGNADVIWVAVKSIDLTTAIQSVPAINAVDAAIVPLLNGIEHVALLRARFGHANVVPATIAVEAERTSPGHIIQRSPFVRLALSVIGEHKLEGIDVKLLHAGFACEFRSDEKTMLWSKLAFLAPFALTSTAADRSVGEIYADDAWRTRLESAVGEACDVATADGATVACEQILTTLKSLPGTMRSSMQKDVSAGRKPELDAIGGAIVRAGRRYGLDVPTIRELIVTIEERINKELR